MVYNITYLVQFLPSQKLCKWVEVPFKLRKFGFFMRSHVIDGVVKVFGTKKKNKPCTSTELHFIVSLYWIIFCIKTLITRIDPFEILSPYLKHGYAMKCFVRFSEKLERQHRPSNFLFGSVLKKPRWTIFTVYRTTLETRVHQMLVLAYTQQLEVL